jgi:hypothetical protein
MARATIVGRSMLLGIMCLERFLGVRFQATPLIKPSRRRWSGSSPKRSQRSLPSKNDAQR